MAGLDSCILVSFRKHRAVSTTGCRGGRSKVARRQTVLGGPLIESRGAWARTVEERERGVWRGEALSRLE